ncbi:unnamed protein product [Calypogeia fissa]
MADLYEVLGVSVTATASEIKQAYRKRSLETHPDRFPVGSRDQQEATARFQEVNDAYYVLSDAGRRKEYDAKRATDDAAAGGYGFWSSSSAESKDSETRSKEQFGSIFEEMMADEGLKDELNQGQYYGVAGGAAGAVLGFIVANVPGALAGAVAGYRLGHIRDTRGKAVYLVFQELPHAEKARMLSLLLAKVLAQLS